MSLNKNQLKFFIAAINHYGEEAKDVRLKDLNEFAVENELIVPTSALKNYCQEKGLVRGHYNLLLTGIVPEIKEPEPEIKPEQTFPSSESVIIESSAFVEAPVVDVKRPKGQLGHYKPEPKQAELEWKCPLYVVSNDEGSVIGIHDSPKGAWTRRKQAFHDHGKMDYEDFITRMKYVGAAYIESAGCCLGCLIEIKELES